jgi:hypothetical protein
MEGDPASGLAELAATTRRVGTVSRDMRYLPGARGTLGSFDARFLMNVMPWISC